MAGHGSNTFWYREQNETQILDILKSAADLSDGSDELKSHISNWATTYQFSPARSYLLHHLTPILQGADVLEIGAGMGAVTPYIASIAAHVDSFEPSEIRYQGLVARTRGLVNVHTHRSGIENFTTNKKYDVIIIIGVLEYAGRIPALRDEKNPAQAFIELAKRFAKKDTKFVIALENRMSMKYFLPNREDHTSLYAESIHDFPNETGIRTYTRPELTSLLSQVGLTHTHYYFPFPDYKTPVAILSDTKKKFDAPLFHFLLSNYSREYHKHRFRFIDEFELMAQYEKLGVLDTFANSFLVVASAEKIGIDDDWIVRRMTPYRAKKYRNEIVLTQAGVVRKLSAMNNRLLSEEDITCCFPLSLRFYHLSLARDFLNVWVGLFSDFTSFARAQIEEGGLGSSESFIELHVNNTMWDDGRLQWFDRETPCAPRADIDLAHVLINSAFTLFEQSEYMYRHYNGYLVKDALRDFIFRSSGIRLDNHDFRKFIQTQSDYLAEMNGVPKASVVQAYENHLYRNRIQNRSILLDTLDHHSVRYVTMITTWSSYMSRAVSKAKRTMKRLRD